MSKKQQKGAGTRDGDGGGNWLPTGETTAKGSLRGVQSREMGPSLGGPGEKSEKPRRKPVVVRDE